MTKVSPLSPIDPKIVEQPDAAEKEEGNSWVKRTIAGSLTGRIIRSSYESLKATGNSVTCLSPWGDQSPLILPNIRFRDLAIESVLAATGGTASIASPVMNMNDALVPSAVAGPNIVVDQVLANVGFKVADDLITGDPVDKLIDASKVNEWKAKLETTTIKELRISLKYKIGMNDAALGFYRSSMHQDADLFAKVKDYLDIEKGWMSPYLFASNRRPVIPRSIHPDFVFCHGPFLAGDYKIGEALLHESASVVSFVGSPAHDNANTDGKDEPKKHKLKDALKLGRSRKHSDPEPAVEAPGSTIDTMTPTETIPGTRRMVILAVGIKPFRKIWSSCSRPGESMINYILFNGCPVVVVPVKTGSPLLAWNTLTLEHLHKLGPGPDFDGIISVFFEFLDLCVDWDRVEIGKRKEEEKKKKSDLREVVRALLEATIRTKDCKEVTQTADLQRSGIAMWRIP